MQMRLVLCSNSTTIQKVVEWSLEDMGFDIVTASKKDKMKDILKRGSADLFIIDQELPKVDGINLCRELKASKESASIPVILLMRKNGTNEVAQVKECKAEKVLEVPFDSKDLKDMVEDLLHLSPLDSDQSSSKENIKELEKGKNNKEDAGRAFEAVDLIEENIFLNQAIKEDVNEGNPAGFEHYVMIWVKEIVQEEIRGIIEQMVPELTKKIVQEQIGNIIDKQTLAKIHDQNREFVSKLMADEAPNIVREVTQRMVPDLAERIIREEIEHIKKGHC